MQRGWNVFAAQTRSSDQQPILLRMLVHFFWRFKQPCAPLNELKVELWVGSSGEMCGGTFKVG
ncbi:unnamed protein product [Cuscuta europaea]|uniref:Uncharacterized protein n=1 Tax=Cuscuta europaea TaxID=41803 RepID=A0A9P0YTM0_CUSEU|nr:unnamed protein product [Cuscuta europaea]